MYVPLKDTITVQFLMVQIDSYYGKYGGALQYFSENEAGQEGTTYSGTLITFFVISFLDFIILCLVCPIAWGKFPTNPLSNISLVLTRFPANFSFLVNGQDFLSVILHQDDFLTASCDLGKLLS